MLTEVFTSAAELMQSRHSVKKYQADATLPEADLNEILTLAASAPSSWNLQHWRYLVITSQAQKEALLPISYNQQQVVESSATVVILGDLEANQSASEIYKGAVTAGFLSQEVSDTLVSQINQAYQNTQFARDEAVLNASLSAMQLMLAAKAKGYDTCPMGGFNREAIVQLLNIPKRFIPVMLVVIGTAATPAHSSSRLPLDQLVIKESF